jgi:hypothetical protein
MTVLMSSPGISIRDLCRDTIPERVGGYLPEEDRAKAAVGRDSPKLAYAVQSSQSWKGEWYKSGTGAGVPPRVTTNEGHARPFQGPQRPNDLRLD